MLTGKVKTEERLDSNGLEKINQDGTKTKIQKKNHPLDQTNLDEVEREELWLLKTQTQKENTSKESEPNLLLVSMLE